ncbi:MAG: M28 family peptidase [Deltaproteobacteria bacterium]
MLKSSVLVVTILAACSDPPVTLAPTDPTTLEPTLDALAAFGEKRAGSTAGQMAAMYIQGKFADLGLTDIHTESFHFPRWQLMDKSFSVTIDGVTTTPGFDVFEAAGAGTVDALVVDAGTATPGDLQNLDLTGKIALVRRDQSYHRSTQLKNVREAGAVAMLYLSVAPQNLRQVGSVRYDWETDDALPAITIGADDGKLITDALAAQKPVTVHIGVSEMSAPGTGTNVIAKIQGEVDEQIVMGAHYDTWFTGSSDNSSGIAELLEVAHRRVQRASGSRPHYTLVFVAYDGEEIGLYGGYDYYRKHAIVGKERLLAVMNFECPSAIDPDIAAVVHSNQPKLDAALQAAHLRQIYSAYAGLEIVAMLFGGIIPTDIQGDYRSGTPTVTTAVTNPYYHTMMDTPATVDLPLLGQSIDGFDDAITNIDKLAATDLDVQDPALWQAEATLAPSGPISASVIVKDANGVPQPNAIVKLAYLTDDFTLAERATGTTDANGTATVTLTTSDRSAPNSFVHVTAGPIYPLVEKILPAN